MTTKRIFDARHAPEDEVEGVRQALEEAGIGFYETQAGNWGLGNAALWVNDPADHARARQVVENFQAEWVDRVRREATPGKVRWVMVPALLLAGALLAWITYALTRW